MRKARPRRRMVVLHGGFHGRTYGALSATPAGGQAGAVRAAGPGLRRRRRRPRRRSRPRWRAHRRRAARADPGRVGHPRSLPTARCAPRARRATAPARRSSSTRSRPAWAHRHALGLRGRGRRARRDDRRQGLGGGLPIGALITGGGSRASSQPGDHGSTFAGGPVVAAAAHAALDVLDDPALLARVARAGRAAAGAPARAPRRPRRPRPRADGRRRRRRSRARRRPGHAAGAAAGRSTRPARRRSASCRRSS